MKIIKLLAVSVLVLGFCACGSSGTSDSPSTATGVELFPTSVVPDASDVVPTNVQLNQSLNPNLTKTLGTSGEFSGPIMAATNTVQFTSLFTDAIFGAIAAGCNTGITDASTSVDCTATFAGTSQAVHIDFRCFDYDGDGTRDDCTGTAAPTASKAAMYRVWVGTAKTRLMAGRITTVPTFTSGAMTLAGAGTGTIQPSVIFSEFNSNVTVKGVWTQTVAGTLNFESYITGTMPTVSSEIPDLDIMHFILAAVQSGSTTTNSLQVGGKFTSSAVVGNPASPFFQVQLVTQWSSGGTYLVLRSQTYDINGNADNTIPYSNQALCAVIATGNAASSPPTTTTACDGEGLNATTLTQISKDYDNDETTALSSSLAAFPNTTEFPLDYATITE